MRPFRRCTIQRGNAFVSRCSLLCLSIALIVSSARLVSGQRWPVAQDENLRRITVSNDDGDVYVESSGDGSEIVLKTEKVRVTDGDIYVGTSNIGLTEALSAVDASLSAQITAVIPPKCLPPGGERLMHNGTHWVCVCAQNWSGSSCESSWMREAKLDTSSTAYERFGYSVAAFEDTVVVGAPYEGSGNVYVYSLSDDSWTLQEKIQSPQGGDIDRFGYAVDIVDDTLAIGAIEDTFDCGQQNPVPDGCGGSVYVFVRSGTAWTQQTKLTASDGASGDNFGSAVSISGNDVAVGALVGSGYSRSGSAYVFSRIGDTWTETAKVVASDGSPNGFGVSIGISGDDLVVGAHGDEEKGSAYIFRRASGTWTEKAKVQETQTRDAGAFGQAVSISGDTLVVSAPHDDNNGKYGSGSAHVYTRVEDTWTKQAMLTAGSDSQTSDQFGYSISVSGDFIALGAPGHGADDSFMGGGSDSGPGAVYVFKRTDDTWSKEAKLMIGIDAGSYDQLGRTVSINTNGTVFAGAPPSNGGSVYVFSFKE